MKIIPTWLRASLTRIQQTALLDDQCDPKEPFGETSIDSILVM